MPNTKSSAYPTFYFPSKVIQQHLPALLCSFLLWSERLFRFQCGPLPQWVVLVFVMPAVSGFHVTQRTHHGDDIFGYMNDVNYATYTSTGKQGGQQQPQQHASDRPSFVVDDDYNKHGTVTTKPNTTIGTSVANIKLVTLSTKPLLLVSSGAPVLSKEECQLLSSYFLTKENLQLQKQMQQKEYDKNYLSNHPGQHVLERLQALLDELILRPEDTIVEPRYIFYEKPKENNGIDKEDAKISDASAMMNSNCNNPVLPDGLHVDTNNVFPLANIHNYNNIDTVALADSIVENDIVDLRHRQLQEAAEYLIQNHIQHTRQKVEVASPPPSPQLSSDQERRATEETMARHRTLLKDIREKQNLIENSVACSSSLRIVPQIGHIAVFFNINPLTGYADPYSFHGSEVSYDEKQVLTFFYELLPNTEKEIFHTPMEFGQQIQKRIRRMQQAYTSSGE